MTISLISTPIIFAVTKLAPAGGPGMGRRRQVLAWTLTFGLALGIVFMAKYVDV